MIFASLFLSIVYVVAPGDTLGEIAAVHDTTVSAIAAHNGIQNPDLIIVGQELEIPSDRPLELGRSDNPVPDASSPPNADLWSVLTTYFPEQPEKALRVVMCESRGIVDINTGNGYHGAWQFSPDTWWGVGGTGYAHQHSFEEQTKRARILYDMRGWQPWPYCGRL